MSKKNFIAPYIMLSAGTGGPGSEVGGGSLQGTPDGLPPMSFADWAKDYGDDLVGEGDGINFNDYVAWWGYMMTVNPEAFTEAAWGTLGNEDWDEYFGD